tara:strand:- start:1319 stop:2008 length:690 start_codon:yes stop_codon:yes gene_type:complete
MIFYKKFLFFFIFLIILFINYRNYFSYNDTIHYFDLDISNSENLVDLINEKGFIKNPQKNFNNSSCKVFNYIDISNNCNKLLRDFNNESFLLKIKNIINEKDLYYMDHDIEPLHIAMQLYQENDFMSYHFDTNFTLGARYTVLIPLYINDKNESFLTIKDKNKNEKKITIKVGQGIVYNGDKVMHKVSKQAKDGKRITLIINLTTNPKFSLIGKLLQKLRNFMFIHYTW